MKKTKWWWLPTVLMVVGMLLPSAFAAQGLQELGKITISKDFELGTDIIPKGEMLLTLDEEELGLVYKLAKENMECSIGIPTEVMDSKEDVRPPRVDVKIVQEKGVSHVRIQLASGLKVYTSLLRCAKEGPAEILSKKEWDSLDPQIRAEVDTLGKALALLDDHAKAIWPEWTEYRGLEFSVTFPNRTVLVATTKERMPALYKKAPLAMPGGKTLYLDRSREMKGRIDPVMTFQGHGDFSGVNVMLIGMLIPETGEGKDGALKPGSTVVVSTPKGEAPPKIDSRADSLDPKARKSAADELRFSRMMMYVHEAFHVLQQRRLVEADQKGLRKHPGAWDRDFVPTLNFALNSELEGEALQKAFEEKNDIKALEYFQDFFVARQLKLKEMSQGSVTVDSNRTLHEGTATYSDVKMAMLIREADIDRKAAGKNDPVSAALVTAGKFVAKETAEAMNMLKGETLDVTQKYYIYGAYWCLLLDRFYPGWKQGLFENDRSLDEVTADFLKLTEADISRIAERLKTDFEYDKIRDRHAKVIKERDDAVAEVMNRKGKIYQIDVKQAQGGFDIFPRDVVFYKREQIYPKGLTHIYFGSLKLTSKETPMRFSKSIIEWIDTEAKPGEKGYEIKFDSHEGDLYKGVTLTTRGFSMTAKAIKIEDDSDKVKISIID